MRVTELQAPNNPPQLAAERYALIKISSLNLMLLQDGIRTLESIADLESNEPPKNGIGWISFQGREWPVYCLNEDLGIYNTLPESYRICALLSIENGFVGLVCNEVILMAKSEFRPQPIPVCMVSAHSPITALVHDEDSMVCLTSSQLLADFLTLQANGIGHIKTNGRHDG